MNYLSVCSGIEAATVAWHKLGWNPVGFSEIEKFPAEVLAHHYPTVTNFGDMTKFKEWEIERNSVELIVGGTPCQSFSVAGLRKGLDDPRGNLALTYCSMLDHFRPKWFVWENVPGVLSSNGGRDFGSFIGAVAQLGYGFSYRVLDAQYFGVAQRRRRVFVVGHLGNWQRAAAVLFERESLRRDTAPSRETREETAKCLTRGVGQRYDPETESLIPSYGIPGNWIGRAPENGGNAVEPMHDIAPCLTKTDKHGVAHPIAFQETADCLTAAYGTKWNGNASATNGSLFAAHPMPINTMVALRHNALGEGTGFGVGEPGDPAYTITKGHSHAVAHPVNIYGGNKRPDRPEGGFYVRMDEGTSKTLDAATGLNPTCSQGGTAVMHSMAVRRLTPVECERLQGFPDNYTNIPWRKKDESPDGPRYKSLGNSMAVPVMRWIGERIKKVNELC